LCGIYILDAFEEEAARIMNDDVGARAGVSESDVHSVRTRAQNARRAAARRATEVAFEARHLARTPAPSRP
jgi:hypothetical protein